MAEDQLAARHQRQAGLSVCRCPCPDRRWPQAPHGGRSRAGYARRRGGLPIGERGATGEQKYYVSNLPKDTTLKALAAAVKARWICEQAHQQLEEELGLDHFEGRSWTGLHRHALMTMIAYAFLQSRRLKAAGWKKEPQDHRLNPPCQPSGKRYSTSSRDRHPCAAHTVTDRSTPNFRHDLPK